MFKIGDLHIGIDLDQKQLKKEYKQVEKTIDKSNKNIDKSVKKTTSIFGGMGAAIKTFVSVYTIGLLKNMSDEFVNMQNSLRQVSDTEEDLNRNQKLLLDLANRTRSDVVATTQAFVRFDKVMIGLGGTQKETAQIVENLNKGLALSGATTQEQASATLQLAQAFGSGKLAGDEFRALSESMPMILDILAKQMGVNRGELKKYSAEGKITSEVLKEALLSATDEINTAFEKSNKTIGQSLVQIKNNLLVTFGELDKQFAITEKLTNGITNTGKAIVGFINKSGPIIINGFGDIIDGVGGILGGLFDGFKQALNGINNLFSDSGDTALSWGQLIAKIFNRVGVGIQILGTVFKGLYDIGQGVGELLNGFDTSKFGGNLKKQFLQGQTGIVGFTKALGSSFDPSGAVETWSKGFDDFSDGMTDASANLITFDKELENNINTTSDASFTWDDITRSLGDLLSATDDATGGTKKNTKAIKENEEANKALIAEIELLQDKYEKTSEVFENSIDLSKEKIEELKDSIADTSEEIDKLKQDLLDLEGERVGTLGERNLEITERQLEITKELAQLKKDENKIVSGEESEKREQEKIDLLAEQIKLIEEFNLIKDNATAKELQDVKDLNELSETARFLKDYEKDKSDLEKNLEDKKLELEQFKADKLIEEEVLSKLTDAKIILEEKYKEKVFLIEQEITGEKYIQDKLRIESLKAVERQAIKTANALRSASGGNSKGFATGGYTGDGKATDVAGLVHKGEYVLPKSMVNALPNLVGDLENMRLGNTDNSRKIEVGSVNVSNGVDLEESLNKIMWQLN